jgi:hypothetical protein
MADAPEKSGRDKKRGAAQGRRYGGFSLCRALTLLCLPLALFAATATWFALTFERVTYPWLLENWPQLERIYQAAPLPRVFCAWQLMCVAAAILWLVASLLGLLWRSGWALWIVHKAYGGAYLLAAIYCVLVFVITGHVADAIIADPEPPVGGYLLELFYWRTLWLAPAACFVVLTMVLHTLSWRRSTVNWYYRRKENSPTVGDRVVENVRTHGSDPRFRKSAYGSAVLHLLVIVVIPYLLTLRGCIRPVRAPLGSGKPTVAMMKVIQPKKKQKKRKKYILSQDSPIIFEAPDLDESELVTDVEQATQLTYVADTSAVHGPMGTGGGNQAGWADGFGDGEIRFIRLEYNGSEWDDGMEPEEGADANFLAEFKRLSGLRGDQVSRYGESHPISHLRKYPKGQAPQFVYMTGSGRIHLSQSDLQTLRDYIREGGMIFGDAGDRHFDGPFRGFANSLFPGNPLRPIADDDPIFQIPFTFPNGPPPLWFHGGKQTMGIKYRGRWVVFYFPGDLNDAWKTGHSGLDPVLAEAAVHVGVNVVYYAVTHYLEETRKYRK